MFYNLTTKFKKKLFSMQVKGIFDTPPIQYKEEKWIILSMVSHDDLMMYLLAIKSFYDVGIGGGRIIVLNDGTLTTYDQELLKAHLVSPQIIDRGVIHIGRFLRHIMWERLAYALDLSQTEYVIQLDADTLTLGALEEVRACVLANRAFTLGEGFPVVSLREASDLASRTDSHHIQTEVEKTLVRLSGAEHLKYVRGSAGLAGLARGGFTRKAAEDFCVDMTTFFPSRFQEWGTDQICFNFIVANSPEADVLPHPAYTCFHPETDVAKAIFLHFIGSYRFDDGIYIREGKRFIRAHRERRHVRDVPKALDSDF